MAASTPDPLQVLQAQLTEATAISGCEVIINLREESVLDICIKTPFLPEGEMEREQLLNRLFRVFLSPQLAILRTVNIDVRYPEDVQHRWKYSFDLDQHREKNEQLNQTRTASSPSESTNTKTELRQRTVGDGNKTVGSVKGDAYFGDITHHHYDRPKTRVTRFGNTISRRWMMGLTGGCGIGFVLFRRTVLQSPRSGGTKLTADDFVPFEFDVVMVNETGKEVSRELNRAKAFRQPIGDTFLDLVAVSGGTFTMGSPDSELERGSAEGPEHEVNVSAFLMGKYPVTQAQWKAVVALPKIERDLEADPANFKGDPLLPVEQVNWDDAVEFCQRLSKQTGREYRLPSEAEWEYACRAGTATPFHFGETITTDLANYRGTDGEYQGKTYLGSYGQGPKGEYRQQTTKVGSFKIANAFGLYDIHGNVWEWCLDYWHDSYEGAPTDGSDWTTGGDALSRVLRGSSWIRYPRDCRSAYRIRLAHDVKRYSIGFRVVCASSWAL